MLDDEYLRYGFKPTGRDRVLLEFAESVRECLREPVPPATDWQRIERAGSGRGFDFRLADAAQRYLDAASVPVAEKQAHDAIQKLAEAPNFAFIADHPWCNIALERQPYVGSIGGADGHRTIGKFPKLVRSPGAYRDRRLPALAWRFRVAWLAGGGKGRGFYRDTKRAGSPWGGGFLLGIVEWLDQTVGGYPASTVGAWLQQHARRNPAFVWLDRERACSIVKRYDRD